MKRILLGILVALALAAPAIAQEVLTLTAPVSTTRSSVRLTRLILDYEARTVTVEWASNLSTEAFSATYNASTSPTGATIIQQVNTMNFSGANPSLFRRVMLRLQQDGFLPAGSFSGSAQ